MINQVMDGNALPACILELLLNLASGSENTNVQIYYFTRTECHNAVHLRGKEHADFMCNYHWHESVEHCIFFHKDSNVCGVVGINNEQKMIISGTHFIIPAETKHFIEAEAGTVMICWHDGLETSFPESMLLTK